ncbi:MAG: circularly permuted type 2 ATP-grasp protein [Pirellulales bacterium]
MSVSEMRSDAGLFGQYAGIPKHYDEVFAAPGKLRPHWRRFVELTGALGTEEYGRRWDQARRLLEQHSLTYPDPSDPTGQRRPWELDPYPLLIAADEWRSIAAALQQRATLLDMVLRDVYGPQELLQRGMLPAEVVYRHPGFRLPYCGQQPPLGRFLHFYAADLTRSPDGQWWVLADHTEAPSGVGFALENRLALSRMLSEVFRHCQVQRLAPYFVAVREELARLAPQHHRDPRIVILTQEAGGHSYFEDAYVARYLGYTLAEAGDLVVRNNHVFMKTLGGLLPVDVLVRRPNSEECDPLELSERSAFGVAGLMNSAHTGRVAVANTLGSGLVESPVFMAFLPGLCQAVLSEPLLMPGIATWWCGNKKWQPNVLSRLDQVDVQYAYRRRGSEHASAKKLADLSRAELAERIAANPTKFIAQERVTRSTAPTWSDGAARPAYVALRVFVVASGDGYTVMPGGLTRVSSSLDSLRLSLVEGHRSKDTWVLSDGPVMPVTLLKSSDEPDVPLRRGGVDLPSRVAEQFFWLGRQVERAESLARLLRTVTLKLTSEADSASLVELPSLLRVLAEGGQIEPGFVVAEIKQQLPAIERVLPLSVFDDHQPHALRATVTKLAHLGAVVRDRISLDTWRILRQMDERFWPSSTESDLADMLEKIDALLRNLSAFTGLVLENMTRTQAWQFLHLGRRLERGLHTSSLIRIMLRAGGATEHAVLEALLEVADSIMTYRSRYLARVQLGPVLDLLLTDESNPRSVAFQLANCAAHVEQLPRDVDELEDSPEKKLAASLLEMIRKVDSQTLARDYILGDTEQLDWLFMKLESTLPKLSDAVSHRYLIHVGPTQRLAEIGEADVARPAELTD